MRLFLASVLCLCLLASVAAQTYAVSGGGNNAIYAVINTHAGTGGTIIINDSATYTESQALTVAPRYSGSRRAFNIEAAAGQNPTIVLNGGGFLAYAGGADAHIGSNSGGRIKIDARNGFVSGANNIMLWYIGQEDGLTAGTACQLTLENLEIDATGLETAVSFGAGGNDASPKTTGAALIARNVTITGPRSGINMLYGPPSYASSVSLINSQLFNFKNDSGDAYGVHLGAFGILTPNATLNVTRSVIFNTTSTAGGGESNSVVARAGQVTVSQSDIINLAATGVSRALTILNAARCSVGSSIIRGDAGTVNFGTGVCSTTYSNVTGASIANSGFSNSNVISEWPVYITYGNPASADNFRVQSGKQSNTYGPTPPLGSVGTGAIPTPIPSATPTPTPTPVAQQNGYISAALSGTTIVSLRFDATGAGNYGMETLSSAGGLRNVQSINLNGPVLTVTPIASELFWDLAFTRAGYYDADRDLNYPNPTNTSGATSVVLPIRELIGSSGNIGRIEHFKRLPLGTYYLNLNIRNGSRLLMRSHPSQNWDVETYWPGCNTLTYNVQEDRLMLIGSSVSGNLQVTVRPRGQVDTPQGSLALPSVRTAPATQINFFPTGKSLSFDQSLTEFMRHAMYWSPGVTAGGEWVMGAVDTLQHADPRSWYRAELRRALLNYISNIGYDRFGHFGYLFAWNRYPDYGAGGLLNVPPGNAPYDMRMLLMNAEWITAISQYVLATGDTAFLNARRVRVVSTNGSQAQPICGAGASTYDFILPAGDIRLDGATPTTRHTLGQSFTTTAAFTQVSAYLGNPSLTDVASGRLRLFKNGINGTLVGSTDFTIASNVSQYRTLTVASQAPGTYYLEVSDNDSSTPKYFGPGLLWWTIQDGSYAGGDAYICNIRADINTMLDALFAYVRDNMGAAATNLAYYQNNPLFNIANHKSGRNAVGTTCTYWEPAGGGYDALTGLWYNAACSALAELKEFQGNAVAASDLRALRTLADTAYQNQYFRTITENGRQVSRFYHVKDWDNVIRDYGYSYYNLEATNRRIATSTQARQILRWLDRGNYSPGSMSNWKSNIYDIWEVAPMFNTIDSSNYYNVTGTLPFYEVVSNGGSRMEIAARDLATRSAYLPIDNMHERNQRVLGRYISPDRLTGGRTYDDPGGRGRWQFLGPGNNRLDFEGFREIFPFGSAATFQPGFYFSAAISARGLHLAPRVPSDLDSIEFLNYGYWRSLFNLKATAQRTTVTQQTSAPQVYALPTAGSVVQSFTAAQPFTKAGVLARVTPFTTKTNNQLTLALERNNSGTWVSVADTWFNHVHDQQWIYIAASTRLGAGEYRIKVSEVRPASGETIGVGYDPGDVLGGGAAGLADGATGSITGDLALRVIHERTQLQVDSVYNPEGIVFALSPKRDSQSTALGGGLVRLTATLEAGDERILTAFPENAAQNWAMFE